MLGLIGQMALYSPMPSLNSLEYPISQKLHGRQQQGSRDDSFCKKSYFFWSQTALFHT